MTGQRAWQLAQVAIEDRRKVLVYFNGVEWGLAVAENGQIGLCPVETDADAALDAIQRVQADGPPPSGYLSWKAAGNDGKEH